jgi:pimeloyl-ACP methyl ester carboxylesterase
MKELASEGVLCVLIEMPFNLAILDTAAADGFTDMYPEIEEWYIGGHSLGGSAASMYLEDNHEAFEGLVLLGSYSTSDLSSYDIDVLSIYGSEDKVMNYENYEEYLVNLPEDSEELIIEGGCHAYFGMYGDQEGDGKPTITNEEQIQITAKKIVDFIS